MIFLTILVAGAIAFANGANDNYKGVATLFGSRTTDYKKALSWATVTTLAGSAAATLLAGALLRSFSGAGLIDPAIAGTRSFLFAVSLGAAVTLLLATRVGLPISTTHALTGALVGAGLAHSGGVNTARLFEKFLIPLLVSPIAAIVLAVSIYPVFRALRKASGITRETCVCIGEEFVPVAQLQSARGEGLAAHMTDAHSITGDAAVMPSVAFSREGCVERYTGRFAGLSAQRLLDSLHFISAGAVSFARGLNDTPKIAALLLAGSALGAGESLVVTGILIAAGGWLASRRVAETVSLKITRMNAGQGFTANILTAFLVIGASRFGMPVSTTHVSCSSLFGIGVVNGEANWSMIRTILLAWIGTLPLATAIAYTVVTFSA